MLENYYRRRNRRRVFNFILMITAFIPPVVAFISWLYIVISLQFSPLNLVTLKASLNYPWYFFPGYFSSSWELVLTENDSLNDGIDDIHYHVNAFHGPLISAKAFDEYRPTYQRLYPIYLKFEMAEESRQKLDGKNIDFNISLGWTGAVTTKYSNYMWRFKNAQNLLARYNINNVSLNLGTREDETDSARTIINFKEEWTLLGHKDFQVDWEIENFRDPNTMNTIDYISGLMELKNSEPRSNLFFQIESVIEKDVAMHCDGSLSHFFTNEFIKLHRFDISEILTGLVSGKIFQGVSVEYATTFLENVISATHPKFFDINISIAGKEFEDFVQLNYDEKDYFTLRGHVSHPLSFRLFDAFSELEQLA